MSESVNSFGYEKLPILESASESSVGESLLEFEGLLAEDVPEWKDAFYRGLGEILSSEIYDHTDYIKYWVKEEKSPRQASKFVQEALQDSKRQLLTAQEVQNYFWRQPLDSDKTTALMLRELERISFTEKDKRDITLKKIIAERLEEISRLEESRKVLARLIPRAMDDIDLRAGSYKAGDTALVDVLKYLKKKAPDFNFEEYIPIWKDRIKYQILPAATIGLDIQRVMELEQVSPGVSERLLHQFGLKNLGRYPVEILLEQIEINGRDLPYGILLGTEADWNNSFHMGSNAIREFFEGAKENGLTIRVAEFNGNVDFIRKLRNFNSQYRNNKIEFAVLGAHGNRELIRTGGEDRKENSRLNSLRLKEMAEREKRALGAIRDFFSADATIILESCSTGQEQGIGQAISEAMSIRVIAPRENASAEKIALVSAKQGLMFEATFKNSDGETVPFSIYENGELK